MPSRYDLAVADAAPWAGAATALTCSALELRGLWRHKPACAASLSSCIPVGTQHCHAGGHAIDPGMLPVQMPVLQCDRMGPPRGCLISVQAH